MNGSGKSTLTRLITGVYLADKGSVTWNGADLATVDPATVWRCTGLVPQIFAQWPLRARENVTLGQPRTLDDGPVWEAVDAVGMRAAVEDLPSGLDTLLAREVFGGVELSGGQWQRLACSRALYRRPALLILDEPTSQMDPGASTRSSRRSRPSPPSLNYLSNAARRPGGRKPRARTRGESLCSLRIAWQVLGLLTGSS
ncbi:ATP-binding cassette domain-containing protein [Streptomyces sp. M19]